MLVIPGWVQVPQLPKYQSHVPVMGQSESAWHNWKQYVKLAPENGSQT